MKKWCREIDRLAEIAITQPQSAYAAYTHGEMHRFTYFLRTIPGMQEYIKPLDDIITNKLIPAILGTTISDQDRKLFSLPVKQGGLGIPILTEKAESDYITSKTITAPLIAIMVTQGSELPDRKEIKEIKQNRMHEVQQDKDEKSKAIIDTLSTETKRAIEQCKEKGGSSWLSVLPIQAHGFTLNKEEFRDAIAIRYNTKVSNLPTKCVCGKQFDPVHAMNCKKGGFVSIRHNNVRDFEASLLEKVCADVQIEPPLQPVNEDQARVDIRARGFWRKGQTAYFDVRITNPNSESQKTQSLPKIYEKHEKEKKRRYNDRILNNEMGSFTPLVFSVSGGMSNECMNYHKHLADKIAQKYNQRYEDVIAYIRCKLSFMILKSALLCLRGSRKANTDCDVEVEILNNAAGLQH